MIGDALNAPSSINVLMRCDEGCCDKDGDVARRISDGTTAAARIGKLPEYERVRKTVLGMSIESNAKQFLLWRQMERDALN